METQLNSPVIDRWQQHYDRYGTRCLFLDNLDPSIDPQNLLDTFSRFGKIHIAEIARSVSDRISDRNQSFGYAPFIEHIHSKGLQLITVENDGNCVFRACAVVLFEDETKHHALRQQVADAMEKLDSAEVQPFLSIPIDKYIKKLRQSTFWVGQLELSLIQRMYQRPIVILDADLVGNQRRVDIGGDGSSIGHATEDTAHNAIYLSYHGQNHYNAVVQRDHDEKQEQEEQQQRQHETAHTAAKNSGLCIFSESSSVDKVLKLRPLYILQRHVQLYRTPEHSPVVGDLCCYASSSTSDRNSASTSESNSSDREFSEPQASAASFAVNVSKTTSESSESDVESLSPVKRTPPLFPKVKSPRSKPLKLSFQRRKKIKELIRSSTATPGSSGATVSVGGATAAAARPARTSSSMWKMVASFAVLIVLVESVYIVYQHLNHVDVVALLDRFKALQNSVKQQQEQTCGGVGGGGGGNVGNT